MTHHPLRLRRRRRSATTVLAGLVTIAVVAGTGTAHAAAPVTAGAPPAPVTPTAAEVSSAPTLTPEDGAYVEGTIAVSSDATAAGDPVTALTVDGSRIEAAATLGSSQLSFDVGSNSIETRFGNYLLVNGEHRIDLTDAVDERVTLPVPNEVLVTGDNSVEIFTGAIDSSCGLNNDDFAVSEVRLDLLGESADGEENEFTYAMGDGSCGSNESLLTYAKLNFFVQGVPGETTGLAADLDTTSLGNGRHDIVARTASGAKTSHRVRVNNAPAGAPRISPTDGTLVAGEQTILAATDVDGGGSIDNLLIDGAVPPAVRTLAAGSAALRFTVGSNSIDTRYYNHLLVNGHRVDIGGDWVSETVEIAFPRHFLLPGDNVISIVTGDINGTSDGERCANLDDFDLSDLSLVVEGGTVTPGDNPATYAMGDGTCGSSSTKLAQADLAFSVTDAPTTRTLSTLGAGDAHLSFFVDGNGTEARYVNYVLVNGMRVDLGDYVGVTADLTIPNEWLLPGTNLVEVVAGAITTSCGENFDDFPLSEISLAPAVGTAALTYRSTRTDGSQYPVTIGDGSCGSSFTGTYAVGLTFEVDGAPQGLRSDIDTAGIPDGEHTLSATSTGGDTATRTLVTDNSAPVVVSSTPAIGQRITSAMAFDLELEDLAGVAGTPEITLDGESLALGDPVGPGLTAGQHTVQVRATDALDNSATREFTFTSAGIPDAPTELTPASGTTGVGRSVDLEAQVAVPGGGDVTATFTAAEVIVPPTGFQGVASAVPTTLEVAGEEEVDTSSLTPLGDGELASPAGRDVTFLRYDLDVSGGTGNPVLRWTGTVDPERVAALRAWDPAAQSWDVLASTRGVADGSSVLTATARGRYVDRGTVHVLVTGEDPFADDIDAGDPNGFADPSAYDFSIAHFTDTQYLSEGAVEQETEAERAIWTAAYGATTKWIAEQAEARKIAYVAHTGDIIENNINAPTTPEMQAQVTGEFEVSSELQSTLDDAGVPNQVIAGNHDNQRGLETGPEAIYNSYYGPDRYEAADDGWGDASYGGPWKEGDNQNNYVLFSAGGLEFVTVGLSYGVTREEADWAASVFARFPDRNGILLSHDYLKPSTNPDGRGSAFSTPDGSLLYRLVVESNPNVFLVLAGHEHGVGTNIKSGVGPTVTHDVVEMLADYQFYTVSADRLGLTEIGGYAPTDRLRFGASFLRMLQFDVDRGEMIVDTYSPFLDEFGATEYDEDERYDGTEDNMVLPVDLTSRTTTFTTDDIAAFVPGDEVGTATVASGEVATTTWDGLSPRTTYAWIATATSPGGGRATAEPGVFRTARAPESVVAADDVEVPFGEDATVTVTITPAGSSDTDGEVVGEIEVREGEDLLASATVVDGVAEVTVPAGLAPGRHDLVASYAGSGWVGGGETDLVLTVGKAGSGVTVTAPDVTSGEQPVVTVTVVGDDEDVTVTGDVRVSEGDEVLGTATLESGTAQVLLPRSLAVGTHELTVDYLGNDDVEVATATATLTVLAEPRVDSSTKVRATPRRVERGAPVELRVTVRSARGGPDGELKVKLGGRRVALGTLVDGRASITVPAKVRPGKRTFKVRFLGSDTARPSADKVKVKVVKRR
jgi:hypothetical protein